MVNPIKDRDVHGVLNPPCQRKAYWIMRLSIVGCFVGHGVFGLLKKPQWLHYLTIVQLSPYWADKICPWVGVMDITLAASILFYPTRAVLLWMVFWTVWTALLRPLAGEGIWEFFERAGNYGMPLAFLVFRGQGSLSPAKPVLDRVILILKISTGLLLIGHGGFSAVQSKEMLIRHYASIGIFLTRPALALIGWFEILLGVGIILRPLRSLLIFIFFWKIGTELLYPLSGAPFWEFVERSSSYGAPLALFFLLSPIPFHLPRRQHDPAQRDKER